MTATESLRRPRWTLNHRRRCVNLCAQIGRDHLHTCRPRAPRITQGPGPASCQSESGVKTGKTKGKTEKERVFEQTARCEGHTTMRLTHSQLGRQSSLRTKTEATSFSVRLSSSFCVHHLLTDAFTAHTPPRRAPQKRFSRETRVEDYVTHKPLLPQRKRCRSEVTRSRDLSHRLRRRLGVNIGSASRQPVAVTGRLLPRRFQSSPQGHQTL